MGLMWNRPETPWVLTYIKHRRISRPEIGQALLVIQPPLMEAARNLSRRGPLMFQGRRRLENVRGEARIWVATHRHRHRRPSLGLRQRAEKTP